MKRLSYYFQPLGKTKKQKITNSTPAGSTSRSQRDSGRLGQAPPARCEYHDGKRVYVLSSSQSSHGSNGSVSLESSQGSYADAQSPASGYHVTNNRKSAGSAAAARQRSDAVMESSSSSSAGGLVRKVAPGLRSHDNDGRSAAEARQRSGAVMESSAIGSPSQGSTSRSQRDSGTLGQAPPARCEYQDGKRVYVLSSSQSSHGSNGSVSLEIL